jgi:hypothetical protein
MISKTNRPLITRTITSVSLVMALVSILTACGNNRQFDSTSWLKGDARARDRMSEDLVNRRILIGKTVDEAKQVLGTLDQTYPTALQYHIDLGWVFKNPIHYGLQVHFDEKRLVREVKIVD